MTRYRCIEHCCEKFHGLNRTGLYKQYALKRFEWIAVLQDGNSLGNGSDSRMPRALQVNVVDSTNYASAGPTGSDKFQSLLPDLPIHSSVHPGLFMVQDGRPSAYNRRCVL